MTFSYSEKNNKDHEWGYKLHSELINFKAERADIKKVELMLNHYLPNNRFDEYKRHWNEEIKTCNISIYLTYRHKSV